MKSTLTPATKLMSEQEIVRSVKSMNSMKRMGNGNVEVRGLKSSGVSIIDTSPLAE